MWVNVGLGMQRVEGWLGHRAGQDAIQKRKISCCCWELNPHSSAVHLTAYSLYGLTYPSPRWSTTVTKS